MVSLSLIPTMYLEINTAALTDAGKYKLEITLQILKIAYNGESTIEVNPVPPSGLLTLVQCDAG